MNILDLLKSLLSLSLGDFIRRNFGTGPGTELLIDVGGVFLLSTFCLLIVIFLIWLTRKLVARMQDRIGPNRVGGRFGLLQTCLLYTSPRSGTRPARRTCCSTPSRPAAKP